MSTPPVVLITGASSGLGEALATAYAAQGAQLALVARRGEALTALRESLQARYPNAPVAQLWVADVCDSTAMQAMAQACLAQLGCPDVVIANAGISMGTLAEAPEDLQAFRKVMDTNWYGTLTTFQPFIAAMQARGRGTLVGVASVAGIRGLPGAAAYSASKSAVIKTLESLRLELSGRGIQVVTLAPGYIRTPMTAHNPYTMPFLMDADAFAQRAVRAIARGERFRVIPWQMGWVARVLHILPRPVYDFLFRHAPRKPRHTTFSDAAE